MRDFSAEDRAQRERLERQSPSGARVDVAGQINRMAAGVASREMAGLAAYVLLRGVQAERRDTDRLNRKHGRMVAAGRIEGVECDEPLAKAASAADCPDRIDRRAVTARQFRARYW